MPRVSKKKAAAAEEEKKQPVMPVEEKDVETLATEKKLKALYKLQLIHSKIDEIRVVRGELPLEVRDIEDEVEGLETRIGNYKADIDDCKRTIKEQKEQQATSESLIQKYKEQQDNVKNNREYTSLEQETEYQSLEILKANKIIQEQNKKIEELSKKIEDLKPTLDEKKKLLDEKREELAVIIEDTEETEKKYLDLVEKAEKEIDPALLHSFNRLRRNMRNGLAVVRIDRGACGGCCNLIPPQRQMEISMHKRIIVCEDCGRVIIDDSIADMLKEEFKIDE